MPGSLESTSPSPTQPRSSIKSATRCRYLAFLVRHVHPRRHAATVRPLSSRILARQVPAAATWRRCEGPGRHQRVRPTRRRSRHDARCIHFSDTLPKDPSPLPSCTNAHSLSRRPWSRRTMPPPAHARIVWPPVECAKVQPPGPYLVFWLDGLYDGQPRTSCRLQKQPGTLNYSKAVATNILQRDTSVASDASLA
ncbi:hypothetical protein EXIGLDRAFT_193574 [Exidia glandulosa HHB12029]|uniref:Uncharacterized protein n=1 Tax=Exidia glandulosa HHB12029 TaxID=1314781 RepID=A0A165EWV0_EXIGL|nr:hypothetical protein EXIGLDRAFT_193574 [Exidia glandulosa HHB12029]